MKSPQPNDTFPSGPWRGFYTYYGDARRHRMELTLEFGNGVITGEGNDDVGPFIISGRYEGDGGRWTKTYVGAHDVFYSGSRKGKYISGTWEFGKLRGDFKLWPLAHGDNDDGAMAQEKAMAIQ